METLKQWRGKYIKYAGKYAKKIIRGWRTIKTITLRKPENTLINGINLTLLFIVKLIWCIKWII